MSSKSRVKYSISNDIKAEICELIIADNKTVEEVSEIFDITPDVVDAVLDEVMRIKIL